MSDWVRYNPSNKNWEDSTDNGANFAELPFHIGNRSFGVGTSSPDSSYRLHVKKIGGSSLLGIQSDDDQRAGIELVRTTGLSGWSMYKPASSLDLRFSDGTDRVWMLQGGNVGIGVSPTFRLDISTSAKEIARFASTHSDGGYVEVGYTPSGGEIRFGSKKGIIGSGAASDPMIYTTQASLYLETNAGAGFFGPQTTDKYILGAITNRWLNVISKRLSIQENTTAPAPNAGSAIIYSDAAYTIKAIFPDGTIKTFTLV